MYRKAVVALPLVPLNDSVTRRRACREVQHLGSLPFRTPC
jgi:hypothetical protein